MVATVTMLPQSPAGRKMRHPKHPFQVRHKPFGICPFLIAPVLPGETLERAMLQSRAVTDPIKNPLVGWWLEHYLFYVKHRDLQDFTGTGVSDYADDLTAMMLDPDYDTSGLDYSSDNLKYYADGATSGARPSFVRMCLAKVVEEYFRNEGEGWDLSSTFIGGLPRASINGNSWLDSATNDTPMAADDMDFASAVAGQGDGTTAVLASEIDKYMTHYQFLRSQNMVNMSYEDWLATHGVRTAQQELHKPELVRYLREWQYPSNTIDPTNGTPRSAVSWSIRDSVDKARYFSEPGFIFGCTVARPKVYLGGQTSTATGLLNDAFAWLPALLRNDPATSLREIAAAAGPIEATDAVWVDLADLFMYGEQFVNFDLVSDDDGSHVMLPTAGLEKRYPTETDVENLFIDELDASGKTLVRQDGIVDLHIKSHVEDHTPTRPA